MKKSIIYLCFYIITTQSYGYEYSEDQFNNAQGYYVAFNSGSGSVQASTITSEFVTGHASCQITYSFNPGEGSYFTALRNYGTTTKDWGQGLIGYYLKVKGGNENTAIQLRIWEDHNGDGQFNGEDEVHVSSKYNANSNTFEDIQILAMTFSKVTGNGDGIVNFNRIRAWDIAVSNTSSSAQNGTLYIDELRLVNNQTLPTNARNNYQGHS